MGLNLTNFAPILKTLYTPDKVRNAVYAKNPFLAQVAKDETFFGENKKVPMIYGNPQGRSATFTVAQQNKGNTASAAFYITRVKNYQILGIDGETLLASQNDAGAFMSARKTEIDGGFQNIANNLSIDLFGTGSGKLGRLASTQNVASSTVTLATANDIVNFEVGMELVLSTTDGGGTVESGSMYVININRNAGTFQVSATAGGAAANISTMIATAAANDYIFADGDYDLKLKGLQAWLPYGGPSSTPFFQVDRTTDSARLAGVWGDLSAMPIEEALVAGATSVYRNGGQVDKVWMSQKKLQDLVNSLGSKVEYIGVDVAGVGFRGVRVNASNQTFDVFADRNCPESSMFMLQSDTWKLSSLYQAPMILNLDTLESLREANSDGIEIRIGYYAQLQCNCPGFNGHFLI